MAEVGKLRLGGGLALAVLLALAGAGNSHAASTFSSIPGGVSFDGDDNPHTIQVIDSDRDLEGRQWELEPDWRQAIKGSAERWAAQVANLAGFDENGEFSIENPLYLAVVKGWRILPTSDLPPRLRTLLEQVNALTAELEKMDKQLREIPHAAIEKLQDLIYQLNRDFISPREAGTKRVQTLAQADADVIEAKVQRDWLAGRLSSLLARIEDEFPYRSPEVDAWLDRTRKLLRRIEVIGERGLARLAVLNTITSVALSALSAYQLYGTITSDRSVVVIDSSGAAVEPGLLCRRVLRKDGGGVVTNAAACPALHMPEMFGGTLALKVNGGNANDHVRILLGNENPFTSIDVRGLGGDDTIEGTALNDRLLGGAGNDTIYGHGGDDRILGDLDVVATSSPGDDMLFGGAGNDFVYGQAGDDLVVGGRDDDATSEGIALSGGLGNDVIVGGPGADEMNGGPGRDSVLAKESDFVKSSGGGERQADVYDPVVDCGEDDGVIQYFTRSNIVGPDGYSETPFGCGTDLGKAPGSVSQLLAFAVKGNRWPWLK